MLHFWELRAKEEVVFWSGQGMDSGFGTRLYHLLAVWPWASDAISLSLSDLIIRYRNADKGKWRNAHRMLSIFWLQVKVKLSVLVWKRDKRFLCGLQREDAALLLTTPPQSPYVGQFRTFPHLLQKRTRAVVVFSCICFGVMKGHTSCIPKMHDKWGVKATQGHSLWTFKMITVIPKLLHSTSGARARLLV